MITCADNHCLICYTNAKCVICDHFNNFALNTNGNSCSNCGGTNMFIDTSDPTFPCVLCYPVNCLTCTGITTCSACDNTLQYFLDPSDSQCYLCSDTITFC